MCIWDSYVYQKVVLCFLIHKSYVRPIKCYCFVHKYAAIPVQLQIFMIYYYYYYERSGDATTYWLVTKEH